MNFSLLLKGSRPYYILFFFSGISGLIYESVWARYLKLFLGHSSYGQLLTLCIYMGGLGLGSFIASRYTRFLKKPLLAYALIEVFIALAGFGFHHLYLLLTDWFYGLDGLSAWSSTGIESLKIGISVLMTLPFAILLGMTFPWMVAGLMRKDADFGQKSVAGLYYINAAGASVGVLLASFYFVPEWGVHGALKVAASLNASLALVVFFLQKNQSIISQPILEKSSKKDLSLATNPWLLLSFLTGLTSFIYEVVWIRMLSLMLGSSSHSFDIMISAFIAGLALGSFNVRKKMQDLKSWHFLLARAQWYMGAAALSTLVFYPLYFKIMNASNEVLQQSDGGYLSWNLLRYVLCLAWMVPTSFFAGQTLPLITCLLQSKTGDESYTGKVYGWNTIGAIAGASLAGLWALPYLGLKGSLWIAGSFDVATGVFVWWYSSAKKTVPGIGLGLVFFLVLATLFVPIDNQMITAGMFRGHKELHRRENMKIAHGRTATISFHETAVHKYIKTNGKPDASISKDKESPLGSDQLTQAGTAFFPIASFQKPYNAAVIGFGSGMSVHYLLSDSLLTQMDMIEIEPQMVELAKGFLPDNGRAFSDPRVRFIYDDARTYFHAQQKKYDLILSVPSNPWVSGVSSLFSKEFYHQVGGFLNGDGLLVQWIQLYEFNSELLLTILNTLDSSFNCARFYLAPGGSDLLILAGPQCKTLDENRFASGTLKEELLKMKHPATLFSEARLLATGEQLRALLRKFPINSDFDPAIDKSSEKARFKKEYAAFFEGFRQGYLSYKELFFTGQGIGFKNLKSNLDEDLPQAVPVSYFSALAQKENWELDEKESFNKLFTVFVKNKSIDQLQEESAEWLEELAQKAILNWKEDPGILGEFFFFKALIQEDLYPAFQAAQTIADQFYLHTLDRNLLRALFIVACKQGDKEFARRVLNKGLVLQKEIDPQEILWLQSLL